MNTNPKQPEISVVIPAYNEAQSIENALRQVAGYFHASGLAGEIVVVDDGSSDETASLARESQASGVRVSILSNQINRGKGFSVRRGILAASGKIVGFADVDMSTPIQELDNVRQVLAAGAQVAIGSRAMSASEIDKHQPWWREAGGQLFGLFVRMTILPGISDSQCGFKFFSHLAAQQIFSHQKLTGWAFDVELLYLARRLGYRIVEVPVRWIDNPDSKVKMLRDGPKMAWDVLGIPWLHRGLQKPKSSHQPEDC